MMIIGVKGGGLITALFFILKTNQEAEAVEGSWSKRADIGGPVSQGDWIPLASGSLSQQHHNNPQPVIPQTRLLQPIEPQFLNQQFQQQILNPWNGKKQESRPQSHFTDEEVTKGRVLKDYLDNRQSKQNQEYQPNVQEKEQVQILYVPVETLRHRSRGLPPAAKEQSKQNKIKHEDDYFQQQSGRQYQQQPGRNFQQPLEHQPHNSPYEIEQPAIPKSLPQRFPQHKHQIESSNLNKPILPQFVSPQHIPHFIAQQPNIPQTSEHLSQHLQLHQYTSQQNSPEPVLDVPHQQHLTQHIFPQAALTPQYPEPAIVQQKIPQQPFSDKNKAKEPFRHPIQPLKDQKPGNLKVTKLNSDYYAIKESNGPIAKDSFFVEEGQALANKPKMYEDISQTRQDSSRNKQIRGPHLQQHTQQSADSSTRQRDVVTKQRPDDVLTKLNNDNVEYNSREIEYPGKETQYNSHENQYSSQELHYQNRENTFNSREQPYHIREQHYNSGEQQFNNREPQYNSREQPSNSRETQYNSREQYSSRETNFPSREPPTSNRESFFPDRESSQHPIREESQSNIKNSEEEDSMEQVNRSRHPSTLSQTQNYQIAKNTSDSAKVPIKQDVPSLSPLPPPNQPPLSVYMETSPDTKVGDVLGLLNGAKTIPVLDTIGSNSPQVFVGPSNLKPPHGYVKFELPYLSSLDGNRVERKVLQLPFFVAPLNFEPPPGYAKIPFPPPHIGSVVLSNVSAVNIHDKDAITLKHTYSSTRVTPTREPYTIPAEISSISPHLPSLINSLQEEQELTTKPELIQETEPTKKTAATRRPVYRGSQRGYLSTTSTSSPRRGNHGHRRRPFNRNPSRQTTETTSTTDSDEQQISQNQQVNNFSKYKEEPHLNSYSTDSEKTYENTKAIRKPVLNQEDEIKIVDNYNQQISNVDFMATTEPVQIRSNQYSQVPASRTQVYRDFLEPSITTEHNANIRDNFELPQKGTSLVQQAEQKMNIESIRSGVYQSEDVHPTTQHLESEKKQDFRGFKEQFNTEVQHNYNLESTSAAFENWHQSTPQFIEQTPSTVTKPTQVPISLKYPSTNRYEIKTQQRDQLQYYEVPEEIQPQYPTYRSTSITTDTTPLISEERLLNNRPESVIEYNTQPTVQETSKGQTKERNRVRGRTYTSRLRTTTATSEEKAVERTKKYSKDDTTEAPKRVNHLRTRRPIRPYVTNTTTVRPSSSTGPPTGTKYLIKTRRPTNVQTKLKVGRSRIRRPTTSTTTTTSTENPFANYNAQINQEQQFYESLPETTPSSNRFSFTRRPTHLQQGIFETREPTTSTRSEVPSDRDELKATQIQNENKYVDVTDHDKDDQWVQNYRQDTYENPFSMKVVKEEFNQPIRIKENAVKDEQWNGQVTVKENEYNYPTTSLPQDAYYNQPIRKKERVVDHWNGEGTVANQKEYESPSRSRTASEHLRINVNPRRHKVKAQKEWVQPTTEIQESDKDDSRQLYKEYYDQRDRQQVTVPKQNSESFRNVKATESSVNRNNNKYSESDFWNQGVTIQQSKSYVYNPEEDVSTEEKTVLTTAGTPTDDFFYDDQSPFPSNEQKVTYVGVKAGFERGKEDQYRDNKEINIGTISGIIDPIVDTNHKSINKTENVPHPKKGERKRGTWIRVRVRKTKNDVFETAESQRFGSSVSNSLHSNIKENEKISQLENKNEPIRLADTKIETTTNIEELTTALATVSDTAESETTTANIAETTTVIPEQETTTTLMETTVYPETVEPKVLGTSTTTEITLETEICYRGRCVKTKRSRPNK